MTKKIIAASALSILLAAGTAFAQITYPTTDTTGTTGSTGATTAADPATSGTTGTVGIPNTGAGGNALENEALLGTSAALALAATAALIARRRKLA